MTYVECPDCGRLQYTLKPDTRCDDCRILKPLKGEPLSVYIMVYALTTFIAGGNLETVSDRYVTRKKGKESITWKSMGDPEVIMIQPINC